MKLISVFHQIEHVLRRVGFDRKKKLVSFFAFKKLCLFFYLNDVIPFLVVYLNFSRRVEQFECSRVWSFWKHLICISCCGWLREDGCG